MVVVVVVVVVVVMVVVEEEEEHSLMPSSLFSYHRPSATSGEGSKSEGVW